VVKRTFFMPLPLVLACTVLAVVSTGREAFGRANGFPSDSCSGCHRGGSAFKPRISADPAKIGPGETTTLTFVIPGSAAGFYFSSNQKGVFTVIPGEGIQKAGTDTGVTHTSPKSGNGGEVTYKVKWTAPMGAPGGVDFDLTAVAANGDGRTSGDAEGIARFNYSFGCDGVDVYLDQDGDGFGLTDLRGPTRRCELTPGWTMKPGDCNDYDKNANPMGTEVCNLYDDDCDGMVNEGLENAMVYKDEDGDGHGARFNAESKVGCGNGVGWSSLRDDCDDTNRMIHPAVKESCNYKDDNCNGRTDEGVRAYCGVGWCRREAASCEANATCIPNQPRDEACNLFDDDCDGVVDNNAPCPAGNACYKGNCIPTAEAEMMKANEPPPPPPDAGAASGGVDAGGSGSQPNGSGSGSGSGEPIGGNGTGTGSGSKPSAPSDDGDGGTQPRFGCSYGGPVGTGGPVLAFVLLLWAVRRRRA
jgi:Putative metal-binding motif